MNVIDFSGKVILTKNLNVDAPATSSNNVNVIQTQELPLQKNNLIVTASLEKDGKVVHSNILYLVKSKELNLDMDYNLKKTVKEVNGKFLLQLQTDKLMKGVRLTTSNAKGSWSDNFFDLLPGQSKEVWFTPSKAEKVNLSQFEIICFNDLQNKKETIQ
jgi:beta-mannosidase